VKIKEKFDLALQNPSDLSFSVHRYPDEQKYRPNSRFGYKAKLFIRVKDISIAEDGTHAKLFNHCGAAAEPLNKPLRKRCAFPFREISIRWNGNVALCCDDWRGQYKCGNAVELGLNTIWQGPEFAAARRFLYQADRGSLTPCNVCDATSYRVGFLPDKMVKKTLPPPTDADRKVASAASAGESYADVVKRPWELELVQISNG
jgi:hypothetical protein